MHPRDPTTWSVTLSAPEENPQRAMVRERTPTGSGAVRSRSRPRSRSSTARLRNPSGASQTAVTRHAQLRSAAADAAQGLGSLGVDANRSAHSLTTKGVMRPHHRLQTSGLSGGEAAMPVEPRVPRLAVGASGGGGSAPSRSSWETPQGVTARSLGSRRGQPVRGRGRVPRLLCPGWNQAQRNDPMWCWLQRPRLRRAE